jgi:biotin-(acetyl-CoA carboxylase) ligase
MVNGKKICGIMIENLKSQEGRSFIVIGIGINITYNSPNEDLSISSLIEYNFPNFQLSDCEKALHESIFTLLTFEVGEHASTLAIDSDTVTITICI